MEDLILGALRDPSNYVGLVLGLFIAFFVSHKGWIVTGKSARDVKAAEERAAAAEARVAELEARLEALEELVKRLEKDLEPYKEWERRRMAQAMQPDE